MPEILIKIWDKGGYELLILVCAIIAVVVLWKTLEKVMGELLKVNQEQHKIQIEQLKAQNNQDVALARIESEIRNVGIEVRKCSK
ncbi:MAG: hypothetical protein HQK65_14715 [Desulfamplus sp.]|nr:hypothetical protein [Desulfamplus sp.]